MAGELAQMYGREGEALERYQAIRMGESCPMPEDCDFCKARLAGSEMVPQTVQWRTKERTVGKERGLLVTIEKRSWQQSSGTYYLCQNCRKILRPPLWGVLPKAIIPALILAPLAIWFCGEDEPLAISLMFPALFSGLALWYLMRSRFTGFPASLGFRVHETTFDGPEQRLITPVFILITLCFLAAGMLGGGGGPPVNLQLARMDGKGGTGTVNMAAVDEQLKTYYQAAGESPRKAGEKLVAGWTIHSQLSDHLYPRSPVFIGAVTELLQAKKLKLQEAVDLIARDTAGKRLVRIQGDGDPTELQVKVGRLASMTHTSMWEAEQAAEQVSTVMKTTGRPKKYSAILDALLQQASSAYGKSLEVIVQGAEGQLGR